jgi:hypothetical protein
MLTVTVFTGFGGELAPIAIDVRNPALPASVRDAPIVTITLVM